MIKNIMLHCTGTPEGREVTVEEIKSWFRANKWVNDGYHTLTHLDGSVSVLQVFNTDNVLERHEMANGAKGYASNTIHLAYVGGTRKGNIRIPKDTRTNAQIDSLLIQLRFLLLLYPDAKIMGHDQVATKDCPSFNVSEWLDANCFDKKNIKYSYKKTVSTKKQNKNHFDFNLTKIEF